MNKKKDVESSTTKQHEFEHMYSRHLIVSVCDLNQWPLDFQGNYERIRGSILEAKRQKSSYRLGPELETCGYSCEDHYLELDTLHHNYEIIARLLSDNDLFGIVIDLGCLIHHSGVRYNARAIILNGEILCIRPKAVLANDSNYHEGRWFTPWRKTTLEAWTIPPVIKKVCNQDSVPIGICLVQFLDTCIGFEICEELFVPNNLHQAQVLNGAEIITNGSASHFQSGKLVNRFNLVLSATKRCGCAYLYSNMVGCDGGRLYFDGGSFISSCGKLLEFIPRFTFEPKGYIVRSAYIDLDEVKAKRSSIMSWAILAASAAVIPKINVPHNICLQDCFSPGSIYKKQFDDPEVIIGYCDEMEELINAPVFWLWDYLIRSNLSGLFVALSGGADSTITVCLIYTLCSKLYQEITHHPTTEKSILLLDCIRNVIKDPKYLPASKNDLCNRLLVTAYMPTAQSTDNSKKRAAAIAKELGCNHYSIDVQPICDSVISTVSKSLDIKTPQFKSNGGDNIQDRALQNVQARVRAILAYTTAQLHSITLGNPYTTPLVVVGSSNADESLFGYFTKYDSSSSDINLIGDLSKEVIRQILTYLYDTKNIRCIKDVLDATPSAELTPICADQPDGQSDEVDMGITYKQLKYLRILRKVELCGPVSMFRRAYHYWFREQNEYNLKPSDIANLVKHFFVSYGKNRHKSTILPPSVHLDGATSDDNRGDFRPFLYNPDWKWQFSHIDLLVDLIENISSPGIQSTDQGKISK